LNGEFNILESLMKRRGIEFYKKIVKVPKNFINFKLFAYFTVSTIKRIYLFIFLIDSKCEL